MKRKLTSEERERIQRVLDEGRLARANMQQILDRVEARRQARLARMQRAPLRRLLAFFRAA